MVMEVAEVMVLEVMMLMEVVEVMVSSHQVVKEDVGGLCWEISDI